jgi:peptidoglycan/xylan/chitin deacetylase (PgdA/CDA1 family)
MSTAISVAKSTLRGVKRRMSSACGLMAMREREACNSLRVLTYHRVLADCECLGYPFTSLVTPLSAFREQMAWLAAHYQVIPLGEAVKNAGAEGKGGSKDRPRLCVTFDDGYADNYELAAPILDELGLRATFFVTTAFIASGTMLWFDRAAVHWRHLTTARRRLAVEVAGQPAVNVNVDSFVDWMGFLKRCSPSVRLRIVGASDDGREAYSSMSVSQIQDLHRRRHEIGSHTVNHPLLPQLADNELCGELQQSRTILQEWLGEAPAGICYPNGDHDDRIVTAARQAGYTYGCTTVRGANCLPLDMMRLRRIHIDPRRVTRGGLHHDELGFRAELCLLGGPRC